MRLVIAMAARFRNFGLPMSDLIQEGHVGLLEAAARFEPEREVRFSTYATWWIRASIQDYILRNWSIVRGGTSSSQKALFFNLRRLRARLAQTTDQRPRPVIHAEIARPSRVGGRHRAHGLAPVGTRHVAERADPQIGRPPTGRFLVDGCRYPMNRHRAIDGGRRLTWLRSALPSSTSASQIVKQRRLQEEGATLESLGESLGISKERVRQIENRALEKLKAALLRENGDTGSFI
jgi:RNA polymerase sigma-32 factor